MILFLILIALAVVGVFAVLARRHPPVNMEVATSIGPQPAVAADVKGPHWTESLPKACRYNWRQKPYSQDRFGRCLAWKLLEIEDKYVLACLGNVTEDIRNLYCGINQPTDCPLQPEIEEVESGFDFLVLGLDVRKELLSLLRAEMTSLSGQVQMMLHWQNAKWQREMDAAAEARFVNWARERGYQLDALTDEQLEAARLIHGLPSRFDLPGILWLRFGKSQSALVSLFGEGSMHEPLQQEVCETMAEALEEALRDTDLVPSLLKGVDAEYPDGYVLGELVNTVKVLDGVSKTYECIRMLQEYPDLLTSNDPGTKRLRAVYEAKGRGR